MCNAKRTAQTATCATGIDQSTFCIVISKSDSTSLFGNDETERIPTTHLQTPVQHTVLGLHELQCLGAPALLARASIQGVLESLLEWTGCRQNYLKQSGFAKVGCLESSPSSSLKASRTILMRIRGRIREHQTEQSRDRLSSDAVNCATFFAQSR
jgi:hypothetical protein